MCSRAINMLTKIILNDRSCWRVSSPTNIWKIMNKTRLKVVVHAMSLYRCLTSLSYLMIFFVGNIYDTYIKLILCWTWTRELFCWRIGILPGKNAFDCMYIKHEFFFCLGERQIITKHTKKSKHHIIMDKILLILLKMSKLWQ